MTRKQIIYLIIIIFFVGAIGSIVVNRFILSWIGLGKWATTAPIVINRKEVVQLNEGANLVDLAKQAGNITVGIYTKDNQTFLGNGIIISGDGLILTTSAIVQNQPKVIVVINDGKNFEGLVRAQDPKSPMVIVSIEAKNLAQAQFADATNAQVGQRILGAGKSNREFNSNFVTGFVTNSVLNDGSLSFLYDSEVLNETFGADAHFSADMIGGPVLNLDGKVVGMSLPNNQFLLSEEMQTGLSSYLSIGKITRPSLGIKYFSLSKELALIRGFQTSGVLVSAVDPTGTASTGGVLQGDLVTEINGQNFDNTSLELVLNKQHAGDLNLKVLRNNKVLDLIVKLIEK